MESKKRGRPFKINQAVSNGLEKNILSADSIIDLIKISAESGLSKLKFGDLELEFGQQSKPPQEAKTSALNPTGDVIPESVIKENEEKGLLEQELLAREEQVERMLIEDPLRAEQLIADGELVPDDDRRVDGDDDE